MSATVSRDEHLRWCKDRALEYADRGDSVDAMASFQSDLGKHPETADHSGIQLMYMLAMAGEFKQPGKLREFIEGCR